MAISAQSLDELASRVEHDLELLDYPNSDWLMMSDGNSGERLLDVAIVGAGQAGLALSFALRRERVRNVVIFEREVAGREGPWRTYARMRTLRTPKYLTGPDLGIPSLTFRAWFEAQPALGTWQSLERIPRLMWMDYLDWYRATLNIKVENGTEVEAVEPDGNGSLALWVRSVAGRQRVLARKVVFCNGMDGAGEWQIPEEFKAAIPPHLRAHTSECTDFSALNGRRVAILGAGAAAMDASTVALQQGAARVDLFCRRATLQGEEPRGWLENNGFLRHYFERDDASRWWIMRRFLEKGSPAPTWSLKEAASHAGFNLHLDCPWNRVRFEGGQISIETPKGTFTSDFAMFGTGLVVDLRRKREFAPIVEHIATWGDRYRPPPEEEYPPLGRYPYLGPAYEFLEKHPGQAPYLRNIHLFNWAATPSNGVSGSSITGMKFGLQRILAGLTRDLYMRIADRHAAAFPVRKYG